MLKRQRRRLLTRQDALQRGLKRYRGKVCAKHPNLKGERMMHGACVRCARDLKQSPKSLARQRAYKRSPESLARQRARQITRPDVSAAFVVGASTLRMGAAR